MMLSLRRSPKPSKPPDPHDDNKCYEHEYENLQEDNMSTSDSSEREAEVVVDDDDPWRGKPQQPRHRRRLLQALHSSKTRLDVAFSMEQENAAALTTATATATSMRRIRQERKYRWMQALLLQMPSSSVDYAMERNDRHTHKKMRKKQRSAIRRIIDNQVPTCLFPLKQQQQQEASSRALKLFYASPKASRRRTISWDFTGLPKELLEQENHGIWKKPRKLLRRMVQQAVSSSSTDCQDDETVVTRHVFQMAILWHVLESPSMAVQAWKVLQVIQRQGGDDKDNAADDVFLETLLQTQDPELYQHLQQITSKPSSKLLLKDILYPQWISDWMITEWCIQSNQPLPLLLRLWDFVLNDTEHFSRSQKMSAFAVALFHEFRAILLAENQPMLLQAKWKRIPQMMDSVTQVDRMLHSCRENILGWKQQQQGQQEPVRLDRDCKIFSQRIPILQEHHDPSETIMDESEVDDFPYPLLDQRPEEWLPESSPTLPEPPQEEEDEEENSPTPANPFSSTSVLPTTAAASSLSVLYQIQQRLQAEGARRRQRVILHKSQQKPGKVFVASKSAFWETKALAATSSNESTIAMESPPRYRRTASSHNISILPKNIVSMRSRWEHFATNASNSPIPHGSTDSRSSHETCQDQETNIWTPEKSLSGISSSPRTVESNSSLEDANTTEESPPEDSTLHSEEEEEDGSWNHPEKLQSPQKDDIPSSDVWHLSGIFLLTTWLFWWIVWCGQHSQHPQPPPPNLVSSETLLDKVSLSTGIPTPRLLSFPAKSKEWNQTWMNIGEANKKGEHKEDEGEDDVWVPRVDHDLNEVLLSNADVSQNPPLTFNPSLTNSMDLNVEMQGVAEETVCVESESPDDELMSREDFIPSTSMQPRSSWRQGLSRFFSTTLQRMDRDAQAHMDARRVAKTAGEETMKTIASLARKVMTTAATKEIFRQVHTQQNEWRKRIVIVAASTGPFHELGYRIVQALVHHVRARNAAFEEVRLAVHQTKSKWALGMDHVQEGSQELWLQTLLLLDDAMDHSKQLFPLLDRWRRHAESQSQRLLKRSAASSKLAFKIWISKHHELQQQVWVRTHVWQVKQRKRMTKLLLHLGMSGNHKTTLSELAMQIFEELAHLVLHSSRNTFRRQGSRYLHSLYQREELKLSSMSQLHSNMKVLTRQRIPQLHALSSNTMQQTLQLLEFQAKLTAEARSNSFRHFYEQFAGPVNALVIELMYHAADLMEDLPMTGEVIELMLHIADIVEDSSELVAAGLVSTVQAAFVAARRSSGQQRNSQRTMLVPPPSPSSRTLELNPNPLPMLEGIKELMLHIADIVEDSSQLASPKVVSLLQAANVAARGVSSGQEKQSHGTLLIRPRFPPPRGFEINPIHLPMFGVVAELMLHITDVIDGSSLLVVGRFVSTMQAAIVAARGALSGRQKRRQITKVIIRSPPPSPSSVEVKHSHFRRIRQAPHLNSSLTNAPKSDWPGIPLDATGRIQDSNLTGLELSELPFERPSTEERKTALLCDTPKLHPETAAQGMRTVLQSISGWIAPFAKRGDAIQKGAAQLGSQSMPFHKLVKAVAE